MSAAGRQHAGAGRRPKARRERRSDGGPRAGEQPRAPQTAEERRAAEIYGSIRSCLTELRACRLVRLNDDSQGAQEEFLALLQRSTPLTQDQKLVSALIQQLGPNPGLGNFFRTRQRPAYGLWSGPGAIVQMLQLEGRLTLGQAEDGTFFIGEDAPAPARGQIVEPTHSKKKRGRKADSGHTLRPDEMIRVWSSFENSSAARHTFHGKEPPAEPATDDSVRESAPPAEPATDDSVPESAPPAEAARPSYAAAAQKVPAAGAAPEPTDDSVPESAPAAAGAAPAPEPTVPAPAEQAPPPAEIEGLEATPHSGMTLWRWGDVAS